MKIDEQSNFHYNYTKNDEPYQVELLKAQVSLQL